MPREFVKCSVADEFVVTVGWRSNGFVQVASEMLGTVEQVRERLAAIEADGEPCRGWHATLDRAEVNSLIRLLRKARDSAYGADA